MFLRAELRGSARLTFEDRVSAHRYRIGQLVSLSSGFGYARTGLTVYRIVALLPQDRAHFQYRIRAASETFDRVAAENELTFRGEE